MDIFGAGSSNSTALNLTSPHTSSEIWHGKFDTAHTTTAALVYSHQSLPAPWPFLLCDLFLSVLLTGWGYKSARRARRRLQKMWKPTVGDLTEWKAMDLIHLTDNHDIVNADYQPPGTVKLTDNTIVTQVHCLPKLPRPTLLDHILDIVSVAISTVRTVTLCISGLRGIQHRNGRLRSCTGIIMAWGPVIDFIMNTTKNRHLAIIMEIDSFLMIAMLQVMYWPKLTIQSNFYGQWFLRGGKCAFAVKSCPANFHRVGCGLNELPATERSLAGIKLFAFDDLKFRNYLADIESLYGIIASFGGAIVGLALFFLVVELTDYYQGGQRRRRRIPSSVDAPYSTFQRFAARYRFTKSAKRGAEIKSSVTDIDEWKLQMKHRYRLADRAVRDSFKNLNFVLVVGLLALLVHYFSQNKPRSVWIIDSQGPLVDNVTNSDSWSDCFHIRPVHNHLGFLEHWWQDVKKGPVNWLSFI